jgi:phytoene dehydrogenase-like protein
VNPTDALAALQPEHPMSISAMAGQMWDVVVVGAGHNGLTTAAYLARAGKSVLVLERRDRIGGAATLEEMWPGYVVSPCAYLAGLLHPTVIDELQLRERGLQIVVGNPLYFAPFEDGTSFTAWVDEADTAASIAAFAPDDVAGHFRRQALFDRIRDALRPESDDDLWLHHSPTREQIEERLFHDPAARRLLFEDSQVDNLRTFYRDERMVTAYAGQGIIGINASPFDPGTAAVDFHHGSGRQEGRAGEWGFVMGGMGVVSAVLADAAGGAGAVIAVGLPVARIRPGLGVELETGDLIRARVVVSNADPVRTLTMMAEEAPADFHRAVERIPIESATAKVTFALAALPDFGAPHATLAQVEIARSAQALHDSYLAAGRGEITDEIWCELYFQTPYDPSIAPPGKHVLSAFCQYVPSTWADGRSWDEHRTRVGETVIRSIERFAPGFSSLIEHMKVEGPPDLEQRLGLTGGHIFHGDIRSEYLWDRRLTYRTGAEGVYLCGAGTHPGGGVISANGRNAARVVLADM